MSEDPDDRATAKRLAALERYSILDSAPESGYDDIVLLATRICETPVALVSLVTDDRQWFKARVGFPGSETPISQSVCAYALRQEGVFIIPDLTQDERTKHNKLVTEAPFIRFYAGALLHTPDHIPIGTLCVIDTKPRPQGLTPFQIDSLQALARQVMSLMELRLALREKTAASEAYKQDQELLRNELAHRLKNILTMVQAIVSQTFRKATNFDEARGVLNNRLIALAKAQEILSGGTIGKAKLVSLIESVAQLYPDALETKRLHIKGPDLTVGPKAALSLTLMLHELTTNATKYGAFSTPDGQVSVAWEITEIPNGEPEFALSWRESGGPPVTAPKRQGFGTQLIKQALASDVGATITLDYRPDGLECRLNAPLSGLMDADSA